MLTVAPGGNNLATICYKDFLGLATINMYYSYYYYYGSTEENALKVTAVKLTILSNGVKKVFTAGQAPLP